MDSQLKKRRQLAEGSASMGLILVLVAMILPFASPMNASIAHWARWIYAAGALIYTIARVVNVSAPNESSRLKRLRRMEFWAGVCFIAGAAFWFYKISYYTGFYAGPLAIMQQTVALTMAGAVVQIIASWMINREEKKERNN